MISARRLAGTGEDPHLSGRFAVCQWLSTGKVVQPRRVLLQLLILVLGGLRGGRPRFPALDPIPPLPKSILGTFLPTSSNIQIDDGCLTPPPLTPPVERFRELLVQIEGERAKLRNRRGEPISSQEASSFAGCYVLEKYGRWVHEVDVVFPSGALNVPGRDFGRIFIEGKVREVVCGRDPDDSATDDYGVCRGRRRHLKSSPSPGRP